MTSAPAKLNQLINSLYTYRVSHKNHAKISKFAQGIVSFLPHLEVLRCLHYHGRYHNNDVRNFDGPTAFTEITVRMMKFSWLYKGFRFSAVLFRLKVLIVWILKCYFYVNKPDAAIAKFDPN